MKKLLFSSIAVACLCLMFVSAFASDVVIVKLKNVQVPNAVSASLQAVNGAGTMVGWALDTKGAYHCLIVAGGNVQFLDHPSTTDTRCYGINSKGDLVGSYLYMPTNKVRGFLFPAGPGDSMAKFIDIAPPASLHSTASAINDLGRIVGSYTTTDGKTHAFLWKNATYWPMDHPGAAGTEAGGINNSGMITVRWWAPPSVANGAMHSAMFDGAAFHSMDMPEAKATFVQHVSDTGDAVLYFRGSDLKFHGAVMHDGKYFKFDFPHAVNTYGMGLNNAGLMVGSYTAATPFSQAFVGLFAIQSIF